MLRRSCRAGLAAGALALSACGGHASPHPRAGTPKAYAAIDPRANRAVAITPKILAGPITAYRRHVRGEIGPMLGDVARMRAAITAGDLAAARAEWLRAYSRYQSIGAAYGAFGDLDAAIDGLPGGLQGGAASPAFTGLHRIELALFKRRSTADARAPAARLARDVAHLRRHVSSMEIAPLDLGLRAHEVLEDALHLELAGVATPWSGAALTALDANIEGTRAIMRQLAPLAARTNRYEVDLAERALDRLDAAVNTLRRPSGFPRWDALGQLDRERITGLTAGAAERLAFIPGLVDPRPPRPVQRPIEAAAP